MKTRMQWTVNKNAASIHSICSIGRDFEDPHASSHGRRGGV